MEITRVTEFSEDTLKALNKLIPQLSDSAPLLNKAHLNSIIDSTDSHLFICRKNDHIIGMLTLAIITIPTCRKAQIEDVVVDKAYLGQGIGQQLTEHAIRICKHANISLINLTCSPWRKAANALYQKSGFEKRATNVYKLEL